MVSSREAARQLPEILRRRVPDEASDAEKQAAFDAVVAHYNLTERYTAFMGAPNGSTLRAPAAVAFWCELAVKLMFDFIPAYHLGKPGRRRNTTGNAVDWIAAGGGVLGVPADLTAFYQAQLVQRIEARMSESGQSKAWVFRWFANEVAITTPHEAAARRALLPRPYRKRGTSASLKEAFNSIPKSVRLNPKEFLPHPWSAPPFMPPGGLF